MPSRGSHASGGRPSLSISSFFDAVSAGRRTSGNHGRNYRVHPPRGVVQTEGSATGSGEWQPTTVSGTSGTAGLGCVLDDEGITSYSQTLQEVRARIMQDLEEELNRVNSKRRGSHKLGEHRQRALRIAFGEPSDNCGAGSGLSSSPRAASRNGRGSGSCETEVEDLTVSAVEFSLHCPYSRLPIRHPVRSRDCRHVQCCDLDSWMVLLDKYRSLRDPKGPCPVCEQRVASSSLEIDHWMLNVIQRLPEGTHMVILDVDGSYRNADVARTKRKEEATMEVDATQEDYESCFVDIVEDDDLQSINEMTGEGMRPGRAVKRHRSPAGAPVEAPDNGAPVLASSGTVRVKTEEAPPSDQSLNDWEIHGTTGHPSQASQDGGVSIVQYVGSVGRGRVRALPSQARLWVPHCTGCRKTLLKGEDGCVETCSQCGMDKEQWTLVRRFEQTPDITLELTAEGTLLLRGVDALSAYLYRAGFQRSLFAQHEYECGGNSRIGAPGVWATSFSLLRIELDFLEACCQRLAEGMSLTDIEAMMVPWIFRIPRRRGSAVRGGSGFTITQGV